MEPKIVRKDAFTVIGVPARGNPMTMDYRDIWENRFMKVHDQVKPLSAEDAYFGAYFATEEENVVDMIAGVAAADDAQAPEGLAARELPAADYAVFECKLAGIAETWQAIMAQWLPASGYAYDPSKAAFEQYPSDCQGPDSDVSIFVPVKPRA